MSGLKRNKPTAVDNIRAFYEDKWNEVELSDKEEEIRSRLSFAFSMLSNANTPRETVPFLVKEFGISDVQATRDIRNAKNLFGDVFKSNKDGQRAILNELSIKAFRKAYELDDTKGMASLLGIMGKFSALDKDDPDIPNFNKLQPNVYPIIIAPALEAKLDLLLQAPGAMNLSKILNKQAETATIIEDDGSKAGADS